MSAQLVQFLLSGLTTGAIYALVALGFAIIYNASRVINFAQGEFVMIGGMAAAGFLGAGLPLPIAVILAVGLAVLVGVDLQRHGQPGMTEDELGVAGRDFEVLQQGGGGVPQMVHADGPQAVMVTDAVE